MTSDLLAELNDQQRAAVTAPDGPALVIAAAGTGKTRTLTHRAALLASHTPIPYILLLTFTNRAAKEMLERTAHLLGCPPTTLHGGTFHSVANRMLRYHANRIGYNRDFSILDEDDSARLLKQCITELGLKGDKKFPKPDILLGLFGLAVNRETKLQETLEMRFPDPKADIDGMIKAHDLYTRYKHEMQAMDFDDLLLNIVRLFRECPDIAAKYQQYYQYILVDEYQDTSHIQSEFVDILAKQHRNLMAVGDDFQSIYSWRGADIDNILSFGTRYPDAHVYKLEQNYRSVPGVLDVANDVIAGNPEQYQKTLVPHRTGDAKPVLVQLSDGRHQARYIVEQVMRLIESGTARPGEIAVLYRSHFHAMELQLELARAQMPYTVVSGVRFFEQAHIKDVVAPLRLAANPADGLAFARWMELLPKVGPKRAQSMWAKLGGRLDLHDFESRATLSDLLPADARGVWCSLESALFPAGDTALLDRPDKFVETFVKDFYADVIDTTFENPRSRQDDILELCTFAAKYPTTAGFLEEMALLTNVDATGQQVPDSHDAEPADTLRLTTVHQAKGLEWKAVFILWMVHGMFPSARALDEPGTMAEERRLFYVAVTRAKDRLWLCSPKMRRTGGPGGGDLQYCAPSTFIDEIDPHKLAIERPVTPAPAWRDYNW